MATTVSVAAAVLYPGTASAQEPAPPVGHLYAPGARPDGLAEEVDEIPIQAQLGGAWSAGNARAVTAHSATRLQWRRAANQLSLVGTANYLFIRGEPEGEGGRRPSVLGQDELYARAQFDRFFLDHNSVYLAVVALTARTSGLRGQVTGRLGYLRVLLARPDHGKLWAEASYDLVEEGLVVDPALARAGQPAERWRHLGRVFVGTEVQLTPTFEIEFGVQVLPNLTDPSDWRAGLAGTLSTAISKTFHSGFNLSGRYFHEPIGDRAPVDVAAQAVVQARFE